MVLASAGSALPSDLAAQSAACDPVGWGEVVGAHFARYPHLGVEDAYKLLHQGVFGSEHAVPDLASARAMLDEEVQALVDAETGGEPLVTAIAPAGRIVRIHLRPYLAAGGDTEALLLAFIETAETVRGGREELVCAAAVVERLVGGRWAEGAWDSFLERMLAAGLPMVHHSEPFEAAYRPAYRVVAGDLVPSLESPAR
jgi:hypothetical protein